MPVNAHETNSDRLAPHPTITDAGSSRSANTCAIWANTQSSTATLATRVTLACLLTGTLFFGYFGFNPSPAQAEEIDTNPVADEFQQQIEESAAAYNEANALAGELEQRIQVTADEIALIEERLPAQQRRAERAMVEMYKAQQEAVSIVDLILSSQSIGDFINRVEYFNLYTRANMDEFEALKRMQTELSEARENLETSKQEALDQADAANAALQAAQAARVEAQRQAAEEARRQAEEAAAAAALAEAAAAASSTEGQASAAAESTAAPAPEPEGAAATDTADWTSDEETFVASWGARINAYLAGSPLSGYGETFARAAWAYGVDPRWSPAISYVESSKGLYCFRPHNAWGWGSVSWDSWESAIYGHVGGLARGYGYTLTYEAACKYCPPTADHWYHAVLAQMNAI